MADTLPSNLDADLPRFGHTAVVVNGTMVRKFCPDDFGQEI